MEGTEYIHDFQKLRWSVLNTFKDITEISFIYTGGHKLVDQSDNHRFLVGK